MSGDMAAQLAGLDFSHDNRHQHPQGYHQQSPMPHGPQNPNNAAPHMFNTPSLANPRSPSSSFSFSTLQTPSQVRIQPLFNYAAGDTMPFWNQQGGANLALPMDHPGGGLVPAGMGGGGGADMGMGLGMLASPFAALDAASPTTSAFHFSDVPPLTAATFDVFGDIYAMGQHQQQLQQSLSLSVDGRHGAVANVGGVFRSNGSGNGGNSTRGRQNQQNNHGLGRNNQWGRNNSTSKQGFQSPQNNQHQSGFRGGGAQQAHVQQQQNIAGQNIVPSYYNYEQGQFYLPSLYMGLQQPTTQQFRPTQNYRGNDRKQMRGNRNNNHGADLDVQYNQFHPSYGNYTTYRPMGMNMNMNMGMGMGMGTGIGVGARPSVPRSAVLQAFVSNDKRKWEINNIIGHIVEFAGDQHGARFLQQKLEQATDETRKKILQELEPTLFVLMSDLFGNYVVQKLFEVCDEQEKMGLAKKLEGKILGLSDQVYGCRVVQKALEHISGDQRDRLIEELQGHIIQCVKGNNANHVIQRLIMLDQCPDFVPQEFAKHVDELACHPYGCRVLQKMFETRPVEQVRVLLDEMHQSTIEFTMDQFANYVIQSVIVCGTEKDRNKVISKFKGSVQILCRHKFASNVIEKALTRATPADRRDLITEMIGAQPDGSDKITILIADAFGNFPVQTALTCADPDQRDILIASLTRAMTTVRYSPAGRRIADKLAEIQRHGTLSQSQSFPHDTTVSDIHDTSFGSTPNLSINNTSHNTSAGDLTYSTNATSVTGDEHEDAATSVADSDEEHLDRSTLSIGGRFGLKGFKSVDELVKGKGKGKGVAGRLPSTPNIHLSEHGGGNGTIGNGNSGNSGGGSGRGRVGGADASDSWRRSSGGGLGDGLSGSGGVPLVRGLRATKSTPPTLREMNEAQALEALLK